MQSTSKNEQFTLLPDTRKEDQQFSPQIEQQGYPRYYLEKIWELLWGPIVRSYIDEETLHNWENEGERFRQTDLILDGNQTAIRSATWLTNIFEEPYMKAYAAESIEAWMEQAGFEAVGAENVWWLNQVTVAIKPISR